jgi:RimJ/RimL family protein N-acetyltransferase
MDLSWLDPEHPDQVDVAGAVAVLDAARAVDAPWAAGETVTSYTVRLRLGDDGYPLAAAVTRDESGRPVGTLRMAMPRWDNPHLASLRVVVDPRVRQRGLGRALFEAGLERIRAEGRTLLCGWSFEGSPGVDFQKAMGLDPVLPEALRRLDVPAMDWSRLDQQYAEAQRSAASAADYELVRMPGPVPGEMLAAVATMTESINDAPTDDLELEDEVFPPERIRAFEAYLAATGRRLYRVLARERTSGTLAGHTVVDVDSERPWLAGQGDTSVVRAHRGHRLGLLLKIEMLRWLREVEPQLRTIDTGNAASNAHMIRVNEELGYEVVGRIIEGQRHLS